MSGYGDIQYTVLWLNTYIEVLNQYFIFLNCIYFFRLINWLNKTFLWPHLHERLQMFSTILKIYTKCAQDLAEIDKQSNWFKLLNQPIGISTWTESLVTFVLLGCGLWFYFGLYDSCYFYWPCHPAISRFEHAINQFAGLAGSGWGCIWEGYLQMSCGFVLIHWN